MAKEIISWQERVRLVVAKPLNNITKRNVITNFVTTNIDEKDIKSITESDSYDIEDEV